MASKVLLVEDDNNLREIYQARLQAEGYDIVSAKDGEEALVIAKQEQPDLIISDVMMPRVSGFEMLDILRNTEGLKDPKVIMLTALGQADDKNRADQLGADRYLVKSQVTLEDIVKAAQDLLNGESGDRDGTQASTSPATTDLTQVTDSTSADPVVVNTPMATPPPADPVDPPAADLTQVTADPIAPIEPSVTPAPTAAGTMPVVTTPVEAPEEQGPNDQLIADALKDPTSPSGNDTQVAEEVSTNDPGAAIDPVTTESPATPPAPVVAPVVAPPQPMPAPSSVSPSTTSNDDGAMTHKKVISPINDPLADTRPDINTLLAREEAKNNMAAVASAPQVPTPAPVVAPVVAPPQPMPQVAQSPAPSAPVTPKPPAAAGEGLDPNAVAL